MANPNLKFHQLPDSKVIELLNTRAIDAQWNVGNAKSPKGKRDAQEDLDLFASAVEVLKGRKTSITINIQKLVEKIEVPDIGMKDQITQLLINAVRDSENGLNEQ